MVLAGRDCLTILSRFSELRTDAETHRSAESHFTKRGILSLNQFVRHAPRRVSVNFCVLV